MRGCASLVSVQIDQFGRLAHAAKRRFLNRLALAPPA